MSILFSIGLYEKYFTVVVCHSRDVNLPYASEFYKNFGVFYCMDRILRVNNLPYAELSKQSATAQAQTLPKIV